MAAAPAPTLDEALRVLEGLAGEPPRPAFAVEGTRLTAALASDMLITTVEEAGAASHRFASGAASSSAEEIAEAMDACLELTSPDHGHLAAAAAMAVAALGSSVPDGDASDPPVPQMWSAIAIAASTTRGHVSGLGQGVPATCMTARRALGGKWADVSREAAAQGSVSASASVVVATAAVRTFNVLAELVALPPVDGDQEEVFTAPSVASDAVLGAATSLGGGRGETIAAGGQDRQATGSLPRGAATVPARTARTLARAATAAAVGASIGVPLAASASDAEWSAACEAAALLCAELGGAVAKATELAAVAAEHAAAPREVDSVGGAVALNADSSLMRRRCSAVSAACLVRAVWPIVGGTLAAGWGVPGAAVGGEASQTSDNVLAVAAACRRYAGTGKLSAEGAATAAADAAADSERARERRLRFASAAASAIARQGSSVLAAAADVEVRALRSLASAQAMLLSEAGARLWDTHRPWFKAARGGHYVLAWGAALRQTTLLLGLPGMVAEGDAHTKGSVPVTIALQQAWAVEGRRGAVWVVASLVREGCLRLAALWGAIRPSRVMMPQLGIDAALALAAVWPALRLCRAVELSVGLGERAQLALDSAVGGLWTALWVAGCLSGPAAAVAGAVKRIGPTLDEGEEEQGDLTAQDIVVSDAAERLEEAAEALGCAVWVSDEAAKVAFPDRLHADTLGRGLWLAAPQAAAPGQSSAAAAAAGASPAAPAADTAPPPGSDKAEAGLFGRAKALGAVGAGAGFVPPRFGPPPAPDPLATAPSDAMWAPILGGRCPVSPHSLVELTSRRQDVGTWDWPKPTADDTAAAELLRPLVDAHTAKLGESSAAAGPDTGSASGNAWKE